MNRSMEDNPDFPSRRCMAFQIWHPPMVAEFDECVPDLVPEGYYVGAWRDERGRILVGLRKSVVEKPVVSATVTPPPVPVARTLAELQTIAGMKGVKYTKATTREDLQATLQTRGLI